MTKKELEKFKKRLLAEKAELEEEMADIGKKNPNAPGGWEATSGDIKVDPADENEVADKLEELEDNAGIMNKLEQQLEEVRGALERIEKGTYGICEDTGEPIDKDRLEANPSARNCIIKPKK